MSTDTPATVGAGPESVKACCAAVYEGDAVALILGESYHPGGLELTRRLARALGLRPGQRVLDVASGPGTTALLLAEEFGVEVDGVDLGRAMVERATNGATDRGLAGRVRFHLGDAERLPFPDGTFDAVVCECAFCTLPDKAIAAAEFARVLRPGGRAGITDVTLQPEQLSERLRTLAGWIACLADARPADEYARILSEAGLRMMGTEAHDAALATMVDQIEARIRALRMLSPDRLAGIDVDAVLGYVGEAAVAVAEGIAGYALLTAERDG